MRTGYILDENGFPEILEIHQWISGLASAHSLCKMVEKASMKASKI
jgi:hypothetical protein